MSDSPYRDDDAALRETRAQLLEERTAELAHADRVVTVLADRIARTAASIGALLPLAIFQALLATSAPALATPAGATSLARALIIGSPLLSSVFYISTRRLALTSATQLHTRIAETHDVHADVERLRVPLDVAALTRRASRLEALSLMAPVFAGCAAPMCFAVQARIELLGAQPLRLYMLEPGLVSRRMGDVEAISNVLVGSAVTIALGWIASGVAAWHLVARQLLADGKRQTATAAAFASSVFFGALLGELGTSGLAESASSVVIGYASLAIGIGGGVAITRAAFGWARTTFARERAGRHTEA